MTADAALVAVLLSICPSSLGGVALRASAGPWRDEWLSLLRRLSPEGMPWRRIPLNIHDLALLGGLDLGATLQAGRPIAQQGVLAQADGGVVLLSMAERLSLSAAARLAAVLDTREVATERDGLTIRTPVSLGVVALDEGAADDEQMPAALLDRLAFHIQLDGRSDSVSQDEMPWQAADVVLARAMLPQVIASDDTVKALCAAALALGIGSLRAPILALRVARAAAALAGQTEVCEEHVSLAARLVLAPRATRWPAAPADVQKDDNDRGGDRSEQEQRPPEPVLSGEPAAPTSALGGADAASSDTHQADADSGKALAETVLEAAQAAIPSGLLAALKVGEAARARVQAVGRSGAAQKSQSRGRPLGARRGEPRAGSRLDVIETLRAAAPWQRLRQQAALWRDQSPTGLPLPGNPGLSESPSGRRIYVRREDFHVTRFKQLGQTTTLFVVDASGSSALNRLAEAKGAVELLLADCYVRRDRVSVLAFRGQTAELLLPPTRSLARAKRSLASLPGGGGTPLATAIDAARQLADQISRRGETPIVVVLTDGRGNIARDGVPGRARAHNEALAAARQLRLAGPSCLLIDTSPTPQPLAQTLAQAMGATYVPLPHAGAHALSQVVRAAATPGQR